MLMALPLQCKRPFHLTGHEKIKPMPQIRVSRDYWNKHPLFSHEMPEVGSARFLNNWMDQDWGRRASALPYWQFDAYAGKRVLDVGCDRLDEVQYARGGARVDSVDLAPRAVI